MNSDMFLLLLLANAPNTRGPILGCDLVAVVVVVGNRVSDALRAPEGANDHRVVLSLNLIGPKPV